MTNTANPCCYDPLNSSKGSHAYPYADYVWAYDATDLARVKTGGKIVDNPSPNLVDGVSPTSTETYKPWHIKPYAYWEIKYPITDSSRGSVASGASAYDESTKTLYLVQTMADYNGSPWKMYPVVHAFKVNVAAPGPGALPPAAPTGLVVK